MTQELAKRPDSPLAAGGVDVEHGGTGSEDLVIPRVSILQALSPDVREGGMTPGVVINSITKETLGDRFLALFAFKQYIKFDEAGKMEWKTINRNEPRVAEGLEWKDDKPPVVTEFLNVLCVFEIDGEWDLSMPVVPSFKKSSLGIGRQFNTLLQMRKRSGKPEYHTPYLLSTFEKQDGQKAWFQPKIVPAPKAKAKVAKDVTDQVVELAKGFLPLIHNITVAGGGAEEDVE